MANPKVIQQAARFFTENGLQYKSIKMFGRLLVVNVYDYETARIVQSVLNGSGIEKTDIEGPIYDEKDYDVTGLVEEALAQHLKDAEEWKDEEELKD